MAFTDRQKINMFTKALVAGVIDSESMAAWYESFFPFAFVMDSTKIWLQLDLLRANPAPNIPTARNNVIGPLDGVLQDYSQNADAIRLTLMSGSNGTTWVAYSVYGDYSSPILDNWLLPQLVPQADGSPSNGYGILLYNGDPNNGGTLISTTTGATGSGESASQTWIFNYANGLLFLSPDFTGTVNDPYIVGFRYIGETVKDIQSGGASSEVIEQIQANITALESSVATNTTDIATNTADIATNASNIATNTAAISANSTEITNNANDITALDGRITTVENNSATTGLIAKFVKTRS